jgi:hypothetical protein
VLSLVGMFDVRHQSRAIPTSKDPADPGMVQSRLVLEDPDAVAGEALVRSAPEALL